MWVAAACCVQCKTAESVMYSLPTKFSLGWDMAAAYTEQAEQLPLSSLPARGPNAQI